MQFKEKGQKKENKTVAISTNLGVEVENLHISRLI